jgi:glycolate oxidase FAD binding subunit
VTSRVLRPQSEADIADILGDAGGRPRTLEIVSGATKREMGRHAPCDALLDTGALSGIVSYQPDELVVTARAATAVAELESVLAARRQMLAFAPADWGPLFGQPLFTPQSGRGTLAGLVAVNACGARRVRAGAVRDHLIGCRFVNGTGEIVKAGGKVVKNVTGFDIPKLMCGAFGTLGVLTELTFRTVPQPERSAALALAHCPPAEGLQALRRAAALPLDPTGLFYAPPPLAAAWLTRRDPRLAGGVALIRVEGSAAAVADKLAVLHHSFAGHDCVTPEDHVAAAFFRAAGDGNMFVSRDAALWRLSVPPSDAYAAVKASGAEFWFADWAGGLIWLELPADTDVALRLRGITRKTGGHAMLMRASAEARRRLDVFEPESPARAGVTAAVKHAFDPARVLNPGRMYEEI